MTQERTKVIGWICGLVTIILLIFPVVWQYILPAPIFNDLDPQYVWEGYYQDTIHPPHIPEWRYSRPKEPGWVFCGRFGVTTTKKCSALP